VPDIARQKEKEQKKMMAGHKDTWVHQ
jgi:hypothetical protein